MMETKFSFCLNDFIDARNNREYLLKISCAYFELNILLSKDELLKIPDVVNARWNNRSCLKLGDCLGAPTWWSLEDDELSILVGFDDESWDFGVGMPKTVLPELLEEIDLEKTRTE